jgi:hypothetical protein
MILSKKNVCDNVTWLSSLNRNMADNRVNCYLVDDIVERKCLCKCYMSCLNCDYMVDDIVERKCLCKCYIAE